MIPPAFERDVVRTHAAMLQLVLNAENGSQAGVIQSYASEIIARFADELAQTALPRHNSLAAGAERALARGRPAVEIRTRARYNTSLDYKRFMVPGILVQLITLVGTLMTALNIVREKEAGTLDQLNVTPIRPAVFIAAKLLPLWIIGLIEFTLGIVIAVVLFGVPLAAASRRSISVPCCFCSPLWVLVSGSPRYPRHSSKQCS